MWPDLIQKAKDGGLDVIETYVFWNGHEPSPGQVEQGVILFLPYGFFWGWIVLILSVVGVKFSVLF